MDEKEGREDIDLRLGIPASRLHLGKKKRVSVLDNGKKEKRGKEETTRWQAMRATRR